VLGVITLLPVGFVLLWVFGMMAATGIPFGPVTSTISGLAIGIGVPFTIHITNRFTEDLVEQPDVDSALRSTLRHTGGALAGSALTTMAGFAILVTSSLVPFRQLGLVVTYAIGFSLVAAILVLPSFLALWARWRGLGGTAPGVAGGPTVTARSRHPS
jgi:predicted RND superfamily exporter protein